MGYASTCFKFFLNTINTLWAIGSLLFIAGAVLSFDHAPLLPVCLVLVIGVLGLVSAILGCCGICNENIKVTIAYAVLLGVSLLLQIIALILASNTNIAHKYAINIINDNWDKEAIKADAEDGMKFPQKEYHCCGKDDPSDYITLLHREYPASCFPHQFVNQSALYLHGCIEKATIHYENFLKNFLGGSWGSIIFTIILLLCAIYLIIRFRKKQSSRRYNYNECPMK